MEWALVLLLAALATQAAAQTPQARSLRIASVVRQDKKTGKLVRSTVVMPATVRSNETAAVAATTGTPGNPPAAEALRETVRNIAAQHALPEALLHSVIRVESNYNPLAISPKGALGIMQLMPATARRFGVADPFDPIDNIRGGARYLRYLLDLYGNNYVLALAAYNAGEGAVARFGAVPPYAETQSYVQMVSREGEAAVRRQTAVAVAVPVPVTAAAQPQEPNHIEEVILADGSVRYVTR
jgi:soluble lytic murein transglycosylase-like protein